jgi:hypothetical protein
VTNRPKQIGTSGESAVAKHLRENGYPNAERRALHGTTDLGDIVGTPFAVEVKAGKAAEVSAPADLLAWQSQTLTETINSGNRIGVLVCKRKGVGATRVGEWWAWLYLPHLAGIWGLTDPAPIWFRTTVHDALVLLDPWRRDDAA